MNFLPIAERELRVAARKRSTFWIRVGAVFLTLVIASSMLFIFSQIGGPMPNKGKILFSILSWMAFAYAVAAGVFLTADSLSEEKREGTLGLLFLTDLRGYDIVLGKLAATSLHAIYGVVAAFPIMALGLMLGGLLAGEFWTGILAILNMLFVSLAAGILASTFTTGPLLAMNFTVGLLGAVLGLPYLIDCGLAYMTGTRLTPRAGMASTLHPLLIATGAVRGTYWLSLVMSHVGCWLCLALAAWRVRRHWQDPPLKIRRANIRRLYGRIDEAARRTRDPILWLAERLQRMRPWMVLPILGVVILVSLVVEPKATRLTITMGVAGFLSLLLMLWMAVHATRFFIEGAKSGAFELVLCAPITPHEIARGQWRAYVRTFTAPVILLVVTEQSLTVAQWVTNVGRLNWSSIGDQVTSVVTWFTTAAAIGWFGMWMGLRSPKPHIAILKTFAIVVLLPTVAMGVLYPLLFALTSLTTFWTSAFPPILLELSASAVVCVLWVAKDAILILWARRNLYLHFRDALAGADLPRGRFNLLALVRSVRLAKKQT